MRTVRLSQLGFMVLLVGMAAGCSSSRVLQGNLQPVPLPPPVIDTEPLPGPGIEPAFGEPGSLLMAPGTKSYTVRNGDSLSKIAQRHGIRVREIVEMNAISNPNHIRIGEVLRLPADARDVAPASSGSLSLGAGPGASYRIKPGDSLSVIAVKHKVTVDALRKANNLRGDRIIAGKTLIIPGAAPVEDPIAIPEAAAEELAMPEDMPSP